MIIFYIKISFLFNNTISKNKQNHFFLLYNIQTFITFIYLPNLSLFNSIGNKGRIG